MFVRLDECEHDSGSFEYHPKDTIYEKMSVIPPNLLLNIVDKYRKVREYCKWCYYRKNEQVCVNVGGI